MKKERNKTTSRLKKEDEKQNILYGLGHTEKRLDENPWSLEPSLEPIAGPNPAGPCPEPRVAESEP